MTAKRVPANIRDAEPRGHPTTIPTTQTVTAQMHSQEEVASDFLSAVADNVAYEFLASA
jgi:hypothetical protein